MMELLSEKSLVRVVKRENNQKRPYLVVNPLQGKHVPVSPGAALGMMRRLGERIAETYPGERLLLVGFAETATAIGAACAAVTGASYIQTTREIIENVDFLFFSEEHSHATEQKLVLEDMERGIASADRIVFVEDEVTTGNTIRNIIALLRKRFPGERRFSVASVLNGMPEEDARAYQKDTAELLFLVKTDHSGYAAIAEQYETDGKYVNCREPESRNEAGFGQPAAGQDSQAPVQTILRESLFPGGQNARRLTPPGAYEEACRRFCGEALKKLALPEGARVLALGTEEFMYPALRLGEELEKRGCLVRSHSTTRSPIAVSLAPGYPLNTRYELSGFYDSARRTFLYNLEAYDTVLIVTDAEAGKSAEGERSLLKALTGAGNRDVRLLRWNNDSSQ